MPDDTPTDSRPALPFRILIVFVAAVLLWLFVYHGTPLGQDYDRLTHAARAVLTTVLVVPMVVLARRLLDRRPWAGLGLPSLRTGWRHLLLGMACWAVPAALGFALCLGFGWVEIGLGASVGEVLQTAALLVVLVFLYEALPEELVFRGYLQRNLVTRMQPWQAVVAQAALFTLFGFLVGAARSIDRILVFFVFALVLGVFRVATGDIWAGIGFHLGFQTVAQLFSGEGAVFETTGLGTLEFVALGGLPFFLGWQAIERLKKDSLDWRTLQPDPGGRAAGAA
ncbi:CPBP family intramembrane glutamic endopeptidase [Actinopolymorpha pittospori]